MEIRTFGGGARLEVCQRELSEALRGDFFSFSRLFLLPIPTTRDKKTITGTEIALADAVREARRGDAVVGYSIPENIKFELEECGAEVYDAALDEELLHRNADLTAHGTLGYILTEFKKDITDMRVGVIGYGRIGECLLRYLLFLGAAVTLYTTRESVAMELCSMGVNASVAFEGLSELDVLINTAPARLLRDFEIRELISHGRIVDLASGNVFSDVDGAVRLPSVPEKFYPDSAGKIYAEHILKFLEKEEPKC